MVGRKADRCRVVGEVRDADRFRVLDQHAEQATALGQVAHHRGGVVVNADVHELGEPLALVGAQHAERAVPGVDELDRGAHDPVQRALELEAGTDRDDGVEQALQAVPRADDLAQPVLQVAEQPVEDQAVRLRATAR
jgi:hypothetical protein